MEKIVIQIDDTFQEFDLKKDEKNLYYLLTDDLIQVCENIVGLGYENYM